MKLPFLASFIIFILVIKHAISKQNKNKKISEQTFWAREQEANSVRRKSLEHLDYIHIPLDKLPMDLMTEDDQVAQYVALIRELSTQTIVNLTGYSNTDLKLEYGTANITRLSAYDQSYTLLASTLQKWAECLYRADYVDETLQILEFALSTHTDVSKTYYLLAEIYHARGQEEQIPALIEEAQNLRSINRSAIVRTLQESYQ